MAALDTKVVVRLMVGDDAAQARSAEKLLASGPCTVAPSVLMECEWVLRAAYALDTPTIDASLRGFLALKNSRRVQFDRAKNRSISINTGVKCY